MGFEENKIVHMGVIATIQMQLEERIVFHKHLWQFRVINHSG